MRQRSILITLIMIVMSACQKNETPPANAVVAITLHSPQEGQVYHTGDTVHVNADISYAGELHGHEVRITDTATGTILYDNPQHVHDDHFTVSESWVNTGNMAMGLKLEMITALDDNGHDTEKVVHISWQP